MGDRTNLGLHLLGTITKSKLAALVRTIEEQEGADEWRNPDKGIFGWNERYAKLETETHSAILNAGLHYCLHWNGHQGAYSAGFEFHHTEDTREWGANDEGRTILLTLAQATNPDILPVAVADQTMLEAGLTVAEGECAVRQSEPDAVQAATAAHPQPFTVLLMLPGWLHDEQPHQSDCICRVWTHAPDSLSAVEAARSQLPLDLGWEDYQFSDLDDYAPVAIYSGHIFDLFQA